MIDVVVFVDCCFECVHGFHTNIAALAFAEGLEEGARIFGHSLSTYILPDDLHEMTVAEPEKEVKRALELIA